MSGALISVFANQRTFNLPPGAPTSVTATAGDGSATVTFTAPAFTGIPPGITGYLATSSPGGFTATGASSPLTITGLTNGTSYTINVQATNGTGYGAAGTSNSVTPAVPEYGLFAGGTLSGGEAISRIRVMQCFLGTLQVNNKLWLVVHHPQERCLMVVRKQLIM